MSRLTVAPTNNYLLKDQQPFFYLADTVWAAFFEAEEHEWQDFLRYRREQGFNTLQLSLLPILHDASVSRATSFPFQRSEDGKIDFFRLNEQYFAHVASMVEQAKHHGLTCALVLLWCNYAPDTWVSQQSPEYVLPFEAVQPYVEYVVKLLDQYQPIYLISGDTDFRSQQTSATYLSALTTVKRLAPDALAGLHISPYADLPREIVEAPELDFYMYQSGHRREEEALHYTLAEKFAQVQPHRPIMNGEPCYEGHGHGNLYGRFQAFDVRKAFWQSVLSGATAGFTYGAHGVWSWHRRGMAFNNEEWSKMPFEWRTAMQLPGAWDISFGAWLFKRFDLFDLRPRNAVRQTPYEAIRVAMTADQATIVIYMPYPVPLAIELDLSDYTFEGIALSTRQSFSPKIEISPTGVSLLEMPEVNTDTLFIGRRL